MKKGIIKGYEGATKVRLGPGSKDNLDDIEKYVDRTASRIVLEGAKDPPRELREILLDRASGYFANLRFLHSLLNSNPQAEEVGKCGATYFTLAFAVQVVK